MKKIIAILAAVAIGNIASAQEPEYAYREGVRSSVVSNILGAAATAAGHLSIASNLYIAGNGVVTGTLAVTGASTLTGTVNVNLIDAVGAVDIDVGSADITDVTLVTDGGTVIIDGIGNFSDDLTCDKIIFTDNATAAPTNAITKGFLVPVNGTNYWIALYPVND